MSRRDARALAAAPFPIAVLHGRSDLLAPASRGAALARRLKASYIELEGAHFVTRERGPEVNALLRQIILHGPEYGADPHRYLAPRPAASVGAESAGSVGAACGGSGGDADADDVVSAPRIELVVVGREGSVGGGGGSPLRLPKAAAARPAPASAVVGQAASGRGAGAAAGNRAAKVAAATTQASASVAQAVASAATQAPGTPNGGARRASAHARGCPRPFPPIAAPVPLPRLSLALALTSSSLRKGAPQSWPATSRTGPCRARWPAG